MPEVERYRAESKKADLQEIGFLISFGREDWI